MEEKISFIDLKHHLNSDQKGQCFQAQYLTFSMKSVNVLFSETTLNILPASSP